jgi:hypothetical protein
VTDEKQVAQKSHGETVVNTLGINLLADETPVSGASSNTSLVCSDHFVKLHFFKLTAIMTATRIEPLFEGNTGRNTRGLLRLVILCTIAAAAIASRLFSVIRKCALSPHLNILSKTLSCCRSGVT